jgi:RNA polymerase sigma-70 factor (ECF subfamily)
MHDIHAKSERRILVRSAALDALSKRFRAALLGYVRRRVSDAAEAEDLVQEVFIRMLRRGDVASIEDARGYLFETASSVLIDRARRIEARHLAEHESVNSIRRAEDFANERIHSGQEAHRRASAALLELPERTRTIFVLRRLEGMKYSQVARLLGISVSAVEKHMTWAVSHLSARVADL